MMEVFNPKAVDREQRETRRNAVLDTGQTAQAEKYRRV